jgi:tRNA1(Val) A37 N6-methylase TrmN6
MVETATDLLLGGQLKLEQPLRGHRAGTDAILLAAAVPEDFAGTLADAGAGVGTAGLAAGLFQPDLDLLLIEREPELAALAQRNLAANGLNGAVVQADLLNPKSRRAAGLADGVAGLVISNPPFLDPADGRVVRGGVRGRVGNAPEVIPPAGSRVTVTITQDGTGGWDISWDTAYVFQIEWSNLG